MWRSPTKSRRVEFTSHYQTVQNLDREPPKPSGVNFCFGLAAWVADEVQKLSGGKQTPNVLQENVEQDFHIE
jgi:hypothetical protein